jgi:hypothetical protein
METLAYLYVAVQTEMQTLDEQQAAQAGSVRQPAQSDTAIANQRVDHSWIEAIAPQALFRFPMTWSTAGDTLGS